MKTLQSAITLYIILLITNNLFGQNLDVFSGLTTNTFHGSDKDPHNYAMYKTGLGYNFGIRYEKVKANRLLLRLTLSYDTYKGKLEAGSIRIKNEYFQIERDCKIDTLNIKAIHNYSLQHKKKIEYLIIYLL